MTEQEEIKRLEWNGEMRTIKELATLAGIAAPTLRGRLWDRDGKENWSLEKAMTTPPICTRTHNERIYYAWGKENTLVGWCEDFNLKVSTVSQRLHRGFTLEKALTKKVAVQQIYALHGHEMSCPEWAKFLMLDTCTLRRRLSGARRPQTAVGKWPLDRMLRRDGWYWFPTAKASADGHPAVYARLEDIARGASVDAEALERRMRREVRESGGGDWTPLIYKAVIACRRLTGQ